MVQRHVDAGMTRQNVTEGGQAAALLAQVDPVLTVETLRLVQRNRMRVFLSPQMCNYIVDIVHGTRAQVQVALGASPRAALALQRASQAAAIMEGREYVTPDDIKKLAPMTLSHRLILHGDAGDGRGAENIVHAVLNETPIP
jgi:MoxR-like ATPase